MTTFFVSEHILVLLVRPVDVVNMFCAVFMLQIVFTMLSPLLMQILTVQKNIVCLAALPNKLSS